MYELLYDFTQRPQPFCKYTTKELWTRPHLARQMLTYHLDQSTELASRQSASIEQVVDWIDLQLQLSGKRLCDLGCGPGLYAQRFAERGAKVTGVDFSSHSLAYGKCQAEETNQRILYINADYLSDTLPRRFDIVTLIYCDYCALSPSQRAVLLRRIVHMLAPGGHIVFDVAGIAALEQKQELSCFEPRLMNGFWAEGDYVGLQRSFIYPEQHLALDRYLILEPDESWEIFNWLQYFTASSLAAELQQAGFEPEQMLGSLSGEKLGSASEVIGVIARKTREIELEA